MAMSGGKDDGSPMMEMNTTPLIDVLLVLLIMFIMSIPVGIDAVNIDLPAPNPDPPPLDQIDPVVNKIVLTPQNQILWNADPIDESELVRNLQITRNTTAYAVEPELQFEPDQSARYAVVDEVLAAIKRSKVTKLGFVGNERYGGAF